MDYIIRKEVNIDIPLIEYLLKKIENSFKNRNPLTITVRPDIGYNGKRGEIGEPGCGMQLFLNVNFTNNTERKISVRINNVDFYPRKIIDFFKFNIEKGVRSIGTSLLKNFQKDISIEPGDSLFLFHLEIKGIKSFNKDDFEKCKDIPMVLKIEYSVSPKYQKKPPCEIEIKDFFEKWINLLVERKFPAWQWENF